MKKKILAMIVFFALTATVFAGCANEVSNLTQNAETSSVVAEKETNLTFVMIPKVDHPWFLKVYDGATKEAEAFKNKLDINVNVDYRAPKTADFTEQNEILLQALNENVAGVMLDPVDYEKSEETIKTLINANIPVIIFDSTAPENSGLTSVGNDFSKQAQIAAEKLVELIGGKGKVAIIEGAENSLNHNERHEAHVKVLSKYPEITIINGGHDNDSIEDAKEQAAKVIAENPDLAGFLNCNASGSGIAEAIIEANMQGKIKFVAMDNLEQILDFIPDTITATSSTLPEKQGMMAVLMCLQASLGLEMPVSVDTGIVYIDETNVDEWKNN